MRRPSVLPLEAPESPTTAPRGRRRSHIIRPNASGALPALRVYVDTEATRTPVDLWHERQTLSFGWAVRELQQKRRKKQSTYEEWCRFTTPDEFFRWLQEQTRERSATYVYAHNWAYDAALLQLQTMADKYEWQVEEYVTAHHILWIAMRKGNRRLLFIDTLNYFATSLAALGDGISWPKLTMPEDSGSVEQWDTYCKNDVALIRYAMNQYFDLIREHDLGKYRNTAASQAYGAWRHRFMHHDVLILADESIERLERQAYHGGRSEVFYDRAVHETVFALDINAMYPSVMSTERFPRRKVAKGKIATLSELRDYLTQYLVIAEVEIDTSVPVYPYIRDDRLIFPVGHFHTTLSTPELQYALEHGHILSVGKWVTYEPAPLFSEYVATFYTLRQQYKADGNAAFSYLTKLLMNSLYGKFGQRGRYWETCDVADLSDWSEWVGNCEAGGPALAHRRRFGIVQHQLVDGEAFESFPAIAAHVTAYARMKLWTLMESAGRRTVLYCDTDSLYVTEAGYTALAGELDDATLGKLKLEKRFPGLHCFAPKDYQWLDGYKIKGVRRNARRISVAEYAARYPEQTQTIAALTSGDWVCYEQVQFEGYDAVLASGRDGEIIVQTVWKVVRRENLQSRGRGVGWREPVQID